jgi:hypothetical protein
MGAMAWRRKKTNVGFLKGKPMAKFGGIGAISYVNSMADCGQKFDQLINQERVRAKRLCGDIDSRLKPAI